MIELNYWAYVTEIWLITGLILVIADIFLGFGFFVLPIGVAALIMSLLIYGENNALYGSFILFENWKFVIVCFSVLSVISVGLLKLFFQRSSKDDPDVNKY